MRLVRSTSFYWQTVAAIALACAVTAGLSGIAIYRVLHSTDGEIAASDPSVWGSVQRILAADGTALMGIIAIVLAIAFADQRHTRERFRGIFEGAAIGIGMDRLDGTILESNRALQTMLGYTRDELSRMTFAEFTHPDDLATDIELFDEMIAGRRDSYQIEKRHIRKDGTSRWIRLTNSLVRDGCGDPQYTIGMVEDITQLKQAQEHIQLYADIVKRMQLGLLVWQLPDLNNLHTFRLLECNPAAQQILQVTVAPASLPGQPMAQAFPDLMATAFPKIYAEVIRSGLARDLGEVRYGDSTIPDRVIATKAFPLPNRCLGLILEDITNRKHAEEALQQSEARFRAVAETATCAFLVYQGNHLRYVNPAAENITGYTRQELMDMNFWELAHPDYQDIVRSRGLARQRGETIPNRYEVKIVTKDGQERWVDITGGSAYLDGHPAALATAYDITHRKQTEAQLLLASDRDRLLSEIALRIRSSLNLEEILNTTVAEVRQFLHADRVFITYLEPNGGCRTVAESIDPHWAPVLGWVADEYAAEEIRQLFEPDTVRVINTTEIVEKTAFLEEYYQRCQVKAGMGVPILLNGEMFGVLIVNQCSAPRQWQPFEIALLKQLGTQVEIAIQQGQLYQQVKALASNLESQVDERTQELHHRMQELQTLNEVKDILLHAVSHDLRTPVQGMLMVLNHLRERGSDSITISPTILECMIESSDRQLRLLNSLMDSHASTPCTHFTLNREPIYLHGLLENSLATLKSQLCYNQATVISQIPTDLPAVSGDPIALQYVFDNLLCNAIKHNPPGRSITLNAHSIDRLPMDETWETENPSNPNAWLYCTIEDNGIGMLPEQCDRLFQLYIRGLDNQHLTGIGLGLHRCHRVITAHGGRIGVESHPGLGSKFWFALPLYSSL